ncbi:hypothetical protein PUV54_06485 [Hyphococcus flavus]|uniref:DUF2178 domain-containing protein n=1 Tax=Hyphococcus flavus TaxID=1866326 RepID=A0AAE9ZHR9_9PROT|nr:hypothetical protein [Hyphococcus flavus]WDI32842.1 hypothetical protein PUV54_06485 [Hyphococcus flavus]
MSFKEKSAWIVLVAMLWIFGGYAWSLYQAGSFGAGTTEMMFGAIIGFVLLVIVAHIVVGIFALKPGDDAEDERDRLIELKADSLSGYVLGAAALTGLAFALFEGDYLIANILFLGLAGSEIAKNAWQVMLYRKGA